jgi:hypothetical protein
MEAMKLYPTPANARKLVNRWRDLQLLLDRHLYSRMPPSYTPAAGRERLL